MTTRYFGERIKRNEDPRLLTGQGLYVDDVDLSNMLHVAFVRSPYAHAKTQVPLAKDKVKFAGEPIVMVLAESRYIAEDALADIQIGYEPLNAVVDLEKALQPDSTLIHEEIGSNIAANVVQRKGDYEAVKENAALIVKRRFLYEHGCAAAIENRGIVAEWDGRAGRLTVWDTTQAPVVIRNGLADMLGVSERQGRGV